MRNNVLRGLAAHRIDCENSHLLISRFKVRVLEGALTKALALIELRLFLMVDAARIVSVVSHRLVSMRTNLVSSLVPDLAAAIGRTDSRC